MFKRTPSPAELDSWPHPERSSPDVSRRTLIGGIAGSAIAYAFGNYLIADGESHTEVFPVSGSEDMSRDGGYLVAGGLGQSSGQPVAERLFRKIDRKRAVDYVEYSSTSFKPLTEIATQVNGYFTDHNPDSTRIVGPSMALPMWLRILSENEARSKAGGVDGKGRPWHPVPPIEELIGFSSPSAWSDVVVRKYGGLVSNADNVFSKIRAVSPLAGKVLGESSQAIIDVGQHLGIGSDQRPPHSLQDLEEALGESWRQLGKSMNFPVYAEMIKFLMETDFRADEQAALLGTVIKPETRIRDFTTEHDPVVWDHRAFETFQRIANGLGSKAVNTVVAEYGHNLWGTSVDAYAEQLLYERVI